MKCRSCLSVFGALLILAPAPAHAQIVITSQDMFNKVGQYYRYHANKGDVSVSGRLGEPGGPQVWNFTIGPTDDVYRFDIIAPNADGNGGPFPQAKFAERKTEESNGSKAWLFMEQVPGVGRKVYGFDEAKINVDKPAVVFTPAIVDFPDTISYGDTWATSMSYTTEFLTIDTQPDPDDPDSGGPITIPLQVQENSTFKVDAFGTVILPNLSFGEALRVNAEVEQVFSVDLDGDGKFNGQEDFTTREYFRTYYWLRRDHGIAVQITSTHSNAGPPRENFTTASQFVRMFETNHPKGGDNRPRAGISGFQIAVNKDQVLLTWNKVATITNYRVEYTTDISKTDGWVLLRTTTSNGLLDTIAPGAPMRFYRVVGISP